MTAVKGGAATRADWRSLVDLMKSADNRAVYDVTLGMVLRTDDGEKGGGAAADDDEIRGGNLGGGRGERSCYEMRWLPRTAGNNCELRFIPHIHCHYRQRLIQWCPSPPPPPPPLPLHRRNCLDYIAEKGGAWFHSIEQGD